MLNKILGRKDKGLDIFNIPDKKYCHDSKKLTKMEKKDLLDEVQHMEKYISNIIHKLEDGKKQYEKTAQKLDQATEKLNVLNSRMANINNEHQQLLVKFQNLQQSLEIMTRQKQQMFKFEAKFIESKQLSRQRVTDLHQILKIYRDQVDLIDKIVYQNKQSKQKYMQLQVQLQNLTKKLEESKVKQVSDENNEVKMSGKSRQQTEPDQDKTNQYKLLLETKQQMVIVLNKKIEERDERLTELEQRVSDLMHEIEKKTAEIKQRDQNIQRYQQQVSQNRKKISELKQEQNELLQNEQKYIQELKNKSSENDKHVKQIIELNHKLKLNEEQKKILIGDQNQKMFSSEQSQKQFQIQKKKYQHAMEVKDREIAGLYSKFQGLIKEKNQLQLEVTNFKSRDKQISKLQDSYLEQTKQLEELQKRLQDQQQNNQIKLKKLEFSYNQERIKAQGLKRSLTQSQQKQQESRKQLDEMYQKKIIQDSKLVKLQNKVKHYKQMIQYLQKQKVEMEKTYEDKMKNMEEIVINEVDDDDHQNNVASDNSQREAMQKDQAIIYKLNSRIVDLEEEINFLKEENRNLSSKKNELEESNIQLERNFKTMNDKRQQMMRQFSKMSSLDNIMVKSKTEQKTQSSIPSREKKVAEKALKGFDILSKHLSQLYKDFLNVHISQIQRKEIKEMEGNINTLVGKCEDMKDIFQGYL